MSRVVLGNRTCCGEEDLETGIVVVKMILMVKEIVANWLTRGSINTKRNGGYAQSWQPIGREK